MGRLTIKAQGRTLLAGGGGRQGRLLVCPGCRGTTWEDAGLRKTARAVRCPACGHVERVRIPLGLLSARAIPVQLTILDPPVAPPRPVRAPRTRRPAEAPGEPDAAFRTIYALLTLPAFNVWRLVFEICLERTRTDPAADRRLAVGRAIELLAADFLAGCAEDEIQRATDRIARFQGTLPLDPDVGPAEPDGGSHG